MASSKIQHEVNDLSRKIDAALDLCSSCKVVVDIKDESEAKFVSFETMFNTFVQECSEKLPTFVDDNVAIDGFLGINSKFLTGKKLIEAVIYSKMFEKSEYEANRDQHEGELVWVQLKEMQCIILLVAVSQNQIICAVDRNNVMRVRKVAQMIWPVFKERVRNNLIDSPRTTELTPDWNKYAENLQSSFDAVAFSNSTSDRYVRYPLTEDVKKVILDEVNSLNLDPRIKQQFVFDLKVLPDKDVFYWRDRVDCLRLLSNSAAISPPEHAMVDYKALVQVAEEKADKKLQQLVESISSLQETVNRNKADEKLQQLVESISSLQETVNCNKADKKLEQLVKNISGLRETVNRNKADEKLQQLVESISSLQETVNRNKADENLQQLVKSISSLQETVNCNKTDKKLEQLVKSISCLRETVNRNKTDEKQQLVKSIASLQETVKLNKINEKLQQLVVSIASLNRIEHCLAQLTEQKKNENSNSGTPEVLVDETAFYTSMQNDQF